MTHHWNFNETFPYKDKITGQEGTFMGNAVPSKSMDYLSLSGMSCLILGTLADPCLLNMSTCTSGYSLAFWIQPNTNATSPQILLGTSRNGSEIHGVFVYQTQVSGNKSLIVEAHVNGLRWKAPGLVLKSTWDFITLTWNVTTREKLRVYLNGIKVKQSLDKNVNDYRPLKKLLKLRGSFPGKRVPASLYLESGGLYDEVMTWNRPLKEHEVKRLFQSQMSKFLSSAYSKSTRRSSPI